MESWVIVVLLAVLVEAITQVFKTGVPESVVPPGWLWPAVSAAIGIAMCVAARVDALSALGVEITVPFIGQVITGLLVSRGSNFLHDIWDKVNNRMQIFVDYDDLVRSLHHTEADTKQS